MKALKMTAVAFILAMLSAVTVQASSLDTVHPYSNFAIDVTDPHMEGEMSEEAQGTWGRDSN